MKKFTVNWGLSHDGDNYAQGDEIELDDDKCIERLLESGVISSSSESDSNDKIEIIVNAIDQLGEGDFTDAGLPELKAIEAITGFKVKAKDRDAAWEIYNQE